MTVTRAETNTSAQGRELKVTPEQVEELLSRRELRNFDFKAPESFASDFRVERAVTIAAMANTPGGGTILVGVAEHGPDRELRGVSPEQRLTFDPTVVGQYLREKLDPAPAVEIADVRMPTGLVLVELRVPEFNDVPIVVKKTLQKSAEKNATGREGDILIRTRAAQPCRVSSAEEMREILGRALSRTSERFLEQMRAVVTGAAPAHLEPSPEERHSAELPEWARQVNELKAAGPNLARWEFRSLPTPSPPRMDAKAVERIVRDSTVSLRGWNFPAIQTGDITFHGDQLTSAVDWDGFHERTSVGYRGAFGFSRILWTESAPEAQIRYPLPPGRPLDFVGILYDITEFLRFSVTMGEKVQAETLWLDLFLLGIQGRKLGTYDQRRAFFIETTAADSAVRLTRAFDLGTLQAGWKDIAVEWARQIYTVFQWPGAGAEMLRKDQENLLQRRP